MIYKMSEWQSPTGNWHCACTSDLAKDSGNWVYPARVLGLTPADYIEFLFKNYKPDDYFWNGEIFICSWAKSNYSNMHKFVLYINRIARNKNFNI